MLIGIAGWIICGALIGFIASKMVELHGDDPRLGIGLGGVSGLVGGWLFSLIGGAPVTHFNLWSIITAALAAIVLLAVFHIIRARAPHVQQTVRRSY